MEFAYRDKLYRQTYKSKISSVTMHDKCSKCEAKLSNVSKFPTCRKCRSQKCTICGKLKATHLAHKHFFKCSECRKGKRLPKQEPDFVRA